MDERLKYVIKDRSCDNIEYIKITKEQVRLLEWLINNDYIMDVTIEEVDDIEFEYI